MNEENKRKMCPIRKMVYCDHKCGWYYKGRCAMVAVAEELETLNKNLLAHYGGEL